jgi:hypothetical protein
MVELNSVDFFKAMIYERSNIALAAKFAHDFTSKREVSKSQIVLFYWYTAPNSKYVVCWKL